MSGMRLALTRRMEPNRIDQQLDALRAAGVSEFELLRRLRLLSAVELLALLREIKPSMTSHAIHKRIERGRLRAEQIHGVWWIDPASAAEWLDWLRKNRS